MTETIVHESVTELAALEDTRAREVNEKHGDDHCVNLGKLRALAKRLKTQIQKRWSPPSDAHQQCQCPSIF